MGLEQKEKARGMWTVFDKDRYIISRSGGKGWYIMRFGCMVVVHGGIGKGY